MVNLSSDSFMKGPFIFGKFVYFAVDGTLRVLVSLIRKSFLLSKLGEEYPYDGERNSCQQ